MLSQYGQVGILPVVQLPARDAQVEAEPGRVRRRVARPRHFLKAFHLTDAHTHTERQAGARHVQDGEPRIFGVKGDVSNWQGCQWRETFSLSYYKRGTSCL